LERQNSQKQGKMAKIARTGKLHTLDEVAAAERQGIAYHLVSYETLVHERDPARAVRRMPANQVGAVGLYRGWMLKPDEYRQLHEALTAKGVHLSARHQQCLNHLLRRADEMAVTATRGAVCFPRRVAELLRAGLDLRDRHAAGEISRHGLAVAGGRLETQLSDLIFPPKTNPANERLAQHLWAHRDDLFTFLRQPALDATNGRAELAIRFGVILRKVWGGSRTSAGTRAQAVLRSVWRTCWQQGRSAFDLLSQLLRGQPAALAVPP
jgi:transposase